MLCYDTITCICLRQTWPFLQKGAYYSGIKICNCLPTEIKVLSDKPKIWKIALKHFCIHTFCILWMNNVIDSVSLINNTVCFLKSYIC